MHVLQETYYKFSILIWALRLLFVAKTKMRRFAKDLDIVQQEVIMSANLTMAPKPYSQQYIYCKSLNSCRHDKSVYTFNESAAKW